MTVTDTQIEVFLRRAMDDGVSSHTAFHLLNDLGVDVHHAFRVFAANTEKMIEMVNDPVLMAETKAFHARGKKDLEEMFPVAH